MKNAIKKILLNTYLKHQFFPGFGGIFFNPFYIARIGLIGSIKYFANQITGRILDVGCGKKPYQKIFANCTEYIGLEIDRGSDQNINSVADFFYDGKTFPFNEKTFDSVITNQVFEHVFNPGDFLTEINRILKDNGKFLLTVPFAWDEHEQPYDYARYSSFGLSHILKQYGFEVIEQKKSVNDIRAIIQMLNNYIYKTLSSKNIYRDILVTLFLISPLNILSELLYKIMPLNDDFYLDNIILARKVKNV